jgi:phosphoserine phosphatase
MTQATEFAPGLFIQNFQAPLKLSDFKLIAFDMDSTLISIECVDEIADAVGRKAEVAAITEAAMRGEITDIRIRVVVRPAHHTVQRNPPSWQM